MGCLLPLFLADSDITAAVCVVARENNDNGQSVGLTYSANSRVKVRFDESDTNEVVMNDSKKDAALATEEAVAAGSANPQPSDAAINARQQHDERQNARRWWIKLLVQPALLLACGAVLIVGLGIAQRLGFISAGGNGSQSHASSGGEASRYICPMMCTPPQSEPGRCPVCAMELVPATTGSGNTDSRSIQIDPAARRIANIHTVAVKSMPMTRTIRAIGELSYDEGTLKTISAYVDGRLDRLYADYKIGRAHV